MKTGIITCVLTALALSAGITSHAHTVSDKKAKRGRKRMSKSEYGSIRERIKSLTVISARLSPTAPTTLK